MKKIILSLLVFVFSLHIGFAGVFPTEGEEEKKDKKDKK